jgi:hypothetical protein
MSLNLALLALLATGGVSASAKTSGSARGRAISGVVTGIDSESRTIEVREVRGGRTVRIRVPDGAVIRTNLTHRQNLPLDQLLVGLTVKGVYLR